MTLSPIPSPSESPDVPIEDLAGDKQLTKQQKIHEASQQFEAILLQQILSEMQKPVISSEFTDDSTAAGIYQDTISHVLSQSIAKSGGFGFAKIFEDQLTPHAAASAHKVSANHSNARPEHPASPLSAKHP